MRTTLLCFIYFVLGYQVAFNRYRHQKREESSSESLRMALKERDSLLRLHENHINRMKIIVGMEITDTFSYANKLKYNIE